MTDQVMIYITIPSIKIR